MNFKSAFTELNAREPTAQDVLRFERITKALGTTPNDSLLAVLVALDYHQSMYDQMPLKINNEVSKTLNAAALASKQIMDTAATDATTALSTTVSKLAQQVANDTAKKSMYKWAIGCITASLITLVVFGYWMHSVGYKDGISAGYEQAKDQKAAAAWSSTTEGQAAYKLAQGGDIRALLECSKDGWEIVKNGTVCIPTQASNGGKWGWRIK